MISSQTLSLWWQMVHRPALCMLWYLRCKRSLEGEEREMEMGAKVITMCLYFKSHLQEKSHLKNGGWGGGER